jgi:CheY-like chemotaxis protein
VLEHDPDLVLLDYVMPRRTGLEVVEELRADPKTAEVKVVFLTGRVDIADEASLDALGVVGSSRSRSTRPPWPTGSPVRRGI